MKLFKYVVFYLFSGVLFDKVAIFNSPRRRGWRWGWCSSTFRLILFKEPFSLVFGLAIVDMDIDVSLLKGYLLAFVLSVFLVHIPWRSDLEVMLQWREFILRGIVLCGKEIGYSWVNIGFGVYVSSSKFPSLLTFATWGKKIRAFNSKY